MRIKFIWKSFFLIWSNQYIIKTFLWEINIFYKFDFWKRAIYLAFKTGLNPAARSMFGGNFTVDNRSEWILKLRSTSSIIKVRLWVENRCLSAESAALGKVFEGCCPSVVSPRSRLVLQRVLTWPAPPQWRLPARIRWDFTGRSEPTTVSASTKS